MQALSTELLQQLHKPQIQHILPLAQEAPPR